MKSLSATQILQIWEQGQQRHPLEQALLLLTAAYPGCQSKKLSQLTIGQRDAGLLQLRALTFGPQLKSLTRCPQCEAQLEFDLSVADIQFTAPLDLAKVENKPLEAAQYDLIQQDYTLQYRLPNSEDLAAIAPIRGMAKASTRLLSRCLLSASYQGMPADVETLPSEVVTQLSTRMIEHDPQSEVLLPLHCEDCGHSWQSLFDIVSFFWTELSNKAKQLLREVHVLASYYSWREADILAMTNVRRQFYLDWLDRST